MSEERIEKAFVKYTFTPKELVEIAQDMAQNHQELRAVEDEKKSAASQFKAQADAITAQLNILSENYRNGYVYKNLDCILTFDFKKKERTYTRPDTGEVVKTEPMRDEDFQTEMSLSDELDRMEEELADDK